MPFAWRPVPGQVALIEVVGIDDCLTGVVLDDEVADGQPVVIDLGATPHPPTDECEVVASFFAPDALYRITATLVPHANRHTESVIDLRIHEVERVQRRQSPRARHELHAVLSNFDDPGAMVSVVGQTADVGEGGCRVVTETAFPPGCDPTVTLTLPDGEDLVLLGAVLQSSSTPDGYEYRIVFLQLEDEDRERLSRLVSELAAA